MKHTDYRLSLDIFKTVSQATLPVKQGDTAYRLCITITANGSPYIITEGCYALFTAKKPDGNFINNKCTIENNTIYYELTKQTTAALGMVECEIVLYDNNDEQLATPHFNILVDKKAYNGEKIVSSSEVNMLEDLIEESKAQIADVEEKLANGEFKGADGISCEHKWEGTVLTVISASGTSSADLQGAKGDTPDLTDYIKNGESVQIGLSTNKAEEITTATETQEIIDAWENEKFALAKGLGNVSLGYDNLALGEKGSLATGRQTKATASYAFSSGLKTSANGYCSRAGGSNTLADADYSKADGFFSEAKAGHAVADGYYAVANGACSHVVNRENTANADNAFVCGHKNAANGANSFVGGSNSIANGDGSFLGGTNIQENGNNNAVFNVNHTIKAFFSAVFGRRNNISGNTYQGFVTGYENELNTDGSNSNNTFVGGAGCKVAKANNSFVFGNYLKLIKQCWGAAVFGSYNDDTSTAGFMIGNGKSDTNRSNSFEVYGNGLVKTPNAPDPTDDYHLATKGYVDSKCSTKQPITIASVDFVGNNTFNYPVHLDTTKTYNATLLFEYTEAGFTDRTVKYFENVSFVDGALRLSVDDEQLVGAIIFANQFYDAAEDTYTNKAGWVRVESDMYYYGECSYKYSITLTEA